MLAITTVATTETVQPSAKLLQHPDSYLPLPYNNVLGLSLVVSVIWLAVTKGIPAVWAHFWKVRETESDRLNHVLDWLMTAKETDEKMLLELQEIKQSLNSYVASSTAHMQELQTHVTLLSMELRK